MRLWKECGMTVVMVTHDLSEAFRLGTRVLTFERKENSVLEPDRFGATVTRDLDVWPPKLAPWYAGAPRKGKMNS